jgi:hypothetical protein
MNINKNLKLILDTYRQELYNEITKLIVINNRISVVEIEVDDYRLFIDINNIVYIESNKKISGKTFGKKVGFLKNCVIHLE